MPSKQNKTKKNMTTNTEKKSKGDHCVTSKDKFHCFLGANQVRDIVTGTQRALSAVAQLTGRWSWLTLVFEGITLSTLSQEMAFTERYRKPFLESMDENQ